MGGNHGSQKGYRREVQRCLFVLFFCVTFVGNVASEMCEPGKYMYAVDFCWPCNSGKYTNDEDSVEGQTESERCLACPLGKVSARGAVTVHSCSDCINGRIIVHGRCDQECGIYTTSSYPWDSCHQCDAGESTLAPGGHCVPCPYGYRYIPVGGFNAFGRCELCAAGKYTDLDSPTTETYVTECTSCPAGTYNVLEENNYCTDCPDGMTSPEGSPGCAYFCSLGSFSDMFYADWWTGDIIESTPCAPCTAGKYAYLVQNTIVDGVGIGECQTCEAGKYSDSTSSLQCVNCEAGKISQYEGADSVDSCLWPCKIAQYRLDTTSQHCTDCPAGTMASTWYTFTPHGRSLQHTCQGCYWKQFSWPGSATCTPDCTPSQYKDETRRRCSECPVDSQPYADSNADIDSCKCAIGHEKSSITTDGNFSCTVCAKDSFRSAYNTSCVPCENNMYTMSSGSNSSEACVAACGSGQYRNTNTQQCVYCNAGSYMSGTQQHGLQATMCTACPIGKISPTHY